MARERFLLAGAVKRMLKRKLSMAFEKWQFTAAALAREKFLLGGALKRLVLRKLSMAWEQWQFVAAELKHQVETVVKTFAVEPCPVD